jgi:WD40 repeat protein
LQRYTRPGLIVSAPTGVTALRFGPGGSTLAFGADGTSVILWDLIKRPIKK